MRPLTSVDIRASFVNATPEQLERMPLPGLHETLWDEREFLGWRDPHAPQFGYIVHWMDGRPVGIVLRAAQGSMRPGITAMCSFCHFTQPSTEVRMFSAARAGEAGRRGDTVGSYLCDDLSCSLLIRRIPTRPEHPHFLEQRAAAVAGHVRGFTAEVLKTA